MNLIEVQDNLKNLSDQQLAQEMQMPSGNAPQYLVLSELQRRQDMRKRFESAQAKAPSTTVAEDALAGAGVPQGGIAQMARSMAPQSSIAQNTGIGALAQPPMPSEEPQRMAGGGMVRHFAEGRIVRGGRTYILQPDGTYLSEDGTSRISTAGQYLAEDFGDLAEGVRAAAQPDVSDFSVSPYSMPEVGDYTAANPVRDMIGGTYDTGAGEAFGRSVVTPAMRALREAAQPEVDGFSVSEAAMPDVSGYTAANPVRDMVAQNYDTGIGEAFGRSVLAPTAEAIRAAAQPDVEGFSVSDAAMPEVDDYTAANPVRDMTADTYDVGIFEAMRNSGEGGPYLPGPAAATELNLPSFRNSGDGGAGLATGLRDAAAEEMTPDPYQERLDRTRAIMDEMARAREMARERENRPPAPDRSGVMGTNAERDLGPFRLPEILQTEVRIGPDGSIVQVPPEQPAADTNTAAAEDAATENLPDTAPPGTPPAAPGGVQTPGGNIVTPADTASTTGIAALPGGGAGGTGGAGGSGVSVPSAAPTSYEQQLIEAMGRAEKRAKQDKWMALAQAGMALMSSKEPTLMGALGEAGIAGLKDFKTARDEAENTRLGLEKSLYDIRAAQAAAAQRAAGAASSATSLDKVLGGLSDAYERYTYEVEQEDPATGQKTTVRVARPGAEDIVKAIEQREFALGRSAYPLIAGQ